MVGAGLGWLIDRWLGISPWGLIVFLLLGFAAGVLNVMRSAGLVAGTAFDDSTGATGTINPALRRHAADAIDGDGTMQVDPIHQFQIKNLLPMAHHGRPSDRFHQFGAVHADHRRRRFRRC